MLLVLMGSLGVLFLWGMIAPRSQWRLLVSWTYRDPHGGEPTGFAYGLYRVVAALGIVTMIFSAASVFRAEQVLRPDANSPPTAVERMWGAKSLKVVNRLVTPVTQVPKGFVDQPILGYQTLDGKRRQPPYLFSLPSLALKLATTRNGYVGVDPPTGLAALDMAQLVVEVAGDKKCFPHHVVVIETESAVQIGVYYGQSNPSDGSNAANIADCDTSGGPRAISTLIPIRLGDTLGYRDLQTLDGKAIRNVPAIE